MAKESTGLMKYRVLSWCIGILCLASVTSVAYVFYSAAGEYGWQNSSRPSDYIDFGIFVGALLTPLVASASLLLFWKTLRVQMRELSESTANLRLSAEANQEIISQNEKLFNLRALHQRLVGELEGMEKLEYFELRAQDAEGKVHKNRFNFNVWIKDTTRHMTLVDLLTQDINKANLNDYLKLLLYYSADVLDYLKLGGKHGHIKKQTELLIEQIEPFIHFYPVIENNERIDTEVKQRIRAISAAAEKMIMAVAQGEDELSSLIFSD